MRTTDPHDPAFPSLYEKCLTKREWFAGMAMQGILAQQEVKGTAADLAISACVSADALIVELNKPSK